MTPTIEGSTTPPATTMIGSMSVLIVEEHEVMQIGLQVILERESWVADCTATNSADAAWQLVHRHRPSVALISTTLPDASGPALSRKLAEEMPDVRILMMADCRADPARVDVLDKHSNPTALFAAIQTLTNSTRTTPCQLTGTPQLSAREHDVLRMLASGYSNPEIAERLFVSRWTIKQHVSAIYRKLGVSNRIQAVGCARENGLLTSVALASPPASMPAEAEADRS